MSERSMRPTGLNTVDDIPSDWRMLRNSAIFVERRDKNHPDLDMYSVTQSRGVIAQAALGGRVAAPSDDRSGYIRILKGDLVYNKMRMWQGAIGVAPAEGIVSPAYVVMTPRQGVNSRYYEYVYGTPAFVAESGRFSYGLCDDMNSLRAEHFKAMMSPAPPTSVQDALVDYLDSETAGIDALIDRKRCFVDLLLEKRAALITHAVTKGLDPTVEMKDSGIACIGMVPVHWEVGSLRRWWEVVDCKHVTVEASDDGYPIISIGQVQDIRVDLEGARRASAEDYQNLTQDGRKLMRGDVVYSRNASVGMAAFLDTDEPVCLGQDVCMLRFRGRIGAGLYLTYQLRSCVGMQQLYAIQRGSTFNRINVQSIRAFAVCQPPVAEQAEIAAFLDRQTAKFDSIVDKTRRSIDLLREYRTALISAAVTGQIDIPAASPSEEVA